jgi:ParB family chromosome partitioning protein
MEEAEGYRRLLEEFGLTQDALGQAVGKSRSHVANTLRLLGLPDPVRDLVRNGILSAGHARALLGTADPGRLAGQVVARGLNVRQTEALAAPKPRQAAHRTPRAATGEEREIATLERDISARLGLKVTVRHGERGGQVTIHYNDLDQLDALVRLLSGGN